MVCSHYRALNNSRFFNAGIICPSQPGAMLSILEKLLPGPTFACDVAACWWTGRNDSAASMARSLSWRASGVCSSVYGPVCWAAFGLGEIMLGEGYALSSNGEGIISKNLDNIRQYIGMVDITTTSKIAHPPNTKPHHLTFQQQHEAAAYLTHEAETSARSSPLSHVTMITTMHGKNHPNYNYICFQSPSNFEEAHRWTCNIQISSYLCILSFVIYLVRRLFPLFVLPTENGELGKDK